MLDYLNYQLYRWLENPNLIVIGFEPNEENIKMLKGEKADSLIYQVLNMIKITWQYSTNDFFTFSVE